MESLCLLHHLEGRSFGNAWRRLAFILAVMTAYAVADITSPPERKLRADLFRNYDKQVRPVLDRRTVTTVYLSLTPLALRELDEEKQIMELDSWIYAIWNDEFLTWNPDEYDGITVINIPSTEIWRPDLAVYTGTPAKKMMIEVFTHAIVNFTGSVIWVPPVDIHSRCPRENDGNQRDSQACVIRMGSWTYHEYMMDIQIFQNEERLEYFKDTNPDWELVSLTSERHSKYYSCCKEPYPAIDFKITLKRRSAGRCSRRCSTAQMSHMMRHHCSFTPRSACDTACDGGF